MNSEKEEKVDTNQSPRDILRITSLLKKRKNLFLDLIQLDQEVLDKEFLDFSKDLEYYGEGALLWANEKYPNMINYFSILYGKVFNIVRFKTKMKDVLDEFFDFTEEVKRSSKKLYLKEKESTQKLVFNNEIKPMDFLTKKIPSIKFINNLLMYLKQQLQSYSDKIQPILQSYSLKISELKESIFKNISKTEFLDNIHQEIDIENDQIKKKRKTWKIVTSLLFYLENSEDVRNFLSEFKEQFKDIQEEAFPNIDESVKKILDENKRFLEKLDEETFAYMNLNLIKNVDSFHIKFSKYIARLCHILTYGNRNYNSSQFFKIDPGKQFYLTRRMLKKLFKHEMKKKYPKLALYLLKMLKYDNYRNLESHDNPKVRFKKGNAYFNVAKKEIKMDLVEITIITNTYSYFIKALRI